jgi:CelD/BcsL family acetyltransferase involved in cellulose biosynthesis
MELSGAVPVYELNPLLDPRWELLVRSHPGASVFHSTNWLRALHQAYGYEPTVVTTSPPGTPLSNGLVFCRIQSWLTGSRLVSLPFSDHCEPLLNHPEELDALLSGLHHQVTTGQYKYLEIRPIACKPSALTGLEPDMSYCLHRLSLDATTQQLFHRFHKSCVQRKIRRAEREKLTYEEGTSDLLLAQFYRLLVITRRRLLMPPQPQAWFRALIAAFGQDLKIRMAYKDRRPVASILTLEHKRGMVYKYGCSDARFNRLGGTALLFWKAIQEAKDKGLQELDMGRSDSSRHGLISFKEHWGAVGTDLNYWRFPTQPGSLSSTWQEDIRRRFVPVTPTYVLRTVGKLLYGHIG